MHQRFLTALHRTRGLAMLGTSMLAAAWREGSPPPCTLAQRLEAFAALRLPLRHPAAVRWNRHQVPFIEASDDRDLAVVLGAVHAHLRLTQIELMRHVARGRLSQVFGTPALAIDHALRAADIGRAVPAIARMLPAQTTAWLSGFADGLNAVIEQRPRPWDMRVLGIEPEPWSLHDLLYVSRLAASDFTWRVWLRLLPLRRRADWQRIWRRLAGVAPLPDVGGGLDTQLARIGHGSNAVAVAARRSASGAPLIASDPHLSLVLPNLWLIAGYKSPSHHAVGLMIPGVPVMALGRTHWIAWGGTNLHAASSDLVDVSDLPAASITVRREAIAVRWSRPREVLLRDTVHGPIISDAALFGMPHDKPVAMRWMGHEPSDEVSAMLALGRARSWSQFVAALEGFALPGQNLVYADIEGHIGQVMAARLPSRPPHAPQDLVVTRAALEPWQRLVGVRDLPQRFDPPEGFVASANDAPPQGKIAVGFFFSPDDRVRRLRELLAAPGKRTREDLVALQTDVTVPAAAALAASLLDLLDERTAVLPVAAALRGWDGTYAVTSQGALAFELVAWRFIRVLHGRRALAVYLATWDPWALLRQDLAHADTRTRRAARVAARRAQRAFLHLGCWGSAHRLRLGHLFAAAPLWGRRMRFADLPAAGANETLMKTAHGFAAGRHAVRYGSNARHIADLGDPDATYAVLLGGQDGWLGSDTFLDQLPLWQQRAMIQLPLRPETVRTAFPHLTLLPRCQGEVIV